MYNVLLVDDEPAIIDMLKRGIEKETSNFVVQGEVFNVAAALSFIKQNSPDVILTDIRMPKVSGVDLIKSVTEMEDYNGICIAVSGYSDFEYVHDAFSYGAYDYLLKPVEPKKISEVFNRIQKLLSVTLDVKQKKRLPKVKVSPTELVKEIESYLADNLNEDNNLITVSHRFMISQPYLSRVFKEHKGVTYNEYLVRLRVEKAKEMLVKSKGYLIGEIADLVGFSDQFYFSKVFKNLVGYTPREYRRLSE